MEDASPHVSRDLDPLALGLEDEKKSFERYKEIRRAEHEYG